MTVEDVTNIINRIAEKMGVPAWTEQETRVWLTEVNPNFTEGQNKSRYVMDDSYSISSAVPAKDQRCSNCIFFTRSRNYCSLFKEVIDSEYQTGGCQLGDYRVR